MFNQHGRKIGSSIDYCRNLMCSLILNFMTLGLKGTNPITGGMLGAEKWTQKHGNFMYET